MGIVRRWGPHAALGLLIALMTATAASAALQGKPEPKRPDSPAFFQAEEATFNAKVEPAEAAPGDSVTYTVTAKIDEPWHIYNHADPIPEGIAAVPTQFDLFGLGGLTPSEGGWTASREPEKAEEQSGVLAFEYFNGTVSWSRELKVPDDAGPGEVDVIAQIYFQICNDTTCKPPTRRTLKPATLTIKASDDAPQASTNPGAGPTEVASNPGAAPTPEPDAPNGAPERRDAPAALRPPEATFETAVSPAEVAPGGTVIFEVRVKLAPTWHIYAYAEETPEGVAAVPTNFDTFDLDGLEVAGAWSPSREAHEPPADVDVLMYKYYEDEVTWSLPLKVPADANAGPRTLYTQIQFQICDPRSCKPSTRVTLPPAVVNVKGGDGSEAPEAGSGASVASAMAATDSPEDDDNEAVEAAASVEAETSESLGSADVASAATPRKAGALQEKIDQGLLAFMGWSALGGLVALLMPCVWPMIPVTVNFFVKQGQPDKEGKRRSTTGLAVTYCLTIIGLFTLIGVAASAIFGEEAGLRIANNPWINLFIAAVLIVFGLGLLGFFEIRLPNVLLNASARNEGRGGIVGVVFMALTLSITSFSCTVPVVGALLVVAARGGVFYPVVGLATFATVLALPFFLLALAPGLLAKLPRSGDWMNSVKLVGGLIELGAAFKFVNAAEVSFGANPENAWFDSQVLLSIWVVVCFVCGLYLLRVFRTDHDQSSEGIGPGRILSGTLFLALALYFAPALFGFPPKGQVYDRVLAGLLPNDSSELNAEEQLMARINALELSGVGRGAPAELELIADSNDPESVQRASSFHGVRWLYSYDVALAAAKKADTPVLIDFTGVNCANCRLMEKRVLPREEVVERLRKFVCVQLYTDRVPVEGLSPIEKEDLALENLKLEVELTNQQVAPLYTIVNPDGELLLNPEGGYLEPSTFVEYLDRGLEAFRGDAKLARAQ